MTDHAFDLFNKNYVKTRGGSQGQGDVGLCFFVCFFLPAMYLGGK